MGFSEVSTIGSAVPTGDSGVIVKIVDSVRSDPGT